VIQNDRSEELFALIYQTYRLRIAEMWGLSGRDLGILWLTGKSPGRSGLGSAAVAIDDQMGKRTIPISGWSWGERDANKCEASCLLAFLSFRPFCLTWLRYVIVIGNAVAIPSRPSPFLFSAPLSLAW